VIQPSDEMRGIVVESAEIRRSCWQMERGKKEHRCQMLDVGYIVYELQPIAGACLDSRVRGGGKRS